MTDLHRLEDNVNNLQRDMAQVGSLVERLDLTIEKLTEVSSNVSQLLAVQVMRLDNQEKMAEKLQDSVEKRKQETDNAIKEVYARIERVEKDLTVDMEKNQDKIIAKIEELRCDGTRQHGELHTRMDRIEKWMWTLIGGSLVIGFILNNSDILIKILT